MSLNRRNFVKMAGVSAGLASLAGCMNNGDEETENGDSDGSDGSDVDTSGGPGSDTAPTDTPELTAIRDIYNNRVWVPAENTVDAIRRTISAYEDRRFEAAISSKEHVVEELSVLSEATLDPELEEGLTEEQFTNMQDGIFQLREANTSLDQAESFRQDDEAGEYEQKLVEAEEHVSLAMSKLPEPEDL